jgi:hypothetical protein
LPSLLDAADPRGDLRGELLPADSVTSLYAETGARLTPGEVADALRISYGEQFRAETERRELNSLELQAVHAIEVREFASEWLTSRRVRPELPLSAAVPVGLGVFQVHLALEQNRFLREIQLSGDFIANADGIETLERELKLCPADWRSIALVTDQIYGRPENYVLGIGKLRTIPDTIVKALPA